MKSWKTTVGGIIGAIGAYFIAQDGAMYDMIGAALEALAFFVIGVGARDNNVTSEEANS